MRLNRLALFASMVTASWIASLLGSLLLLAGCGSPRPIAANQNAANASAALRPHAHTHTPDSPTHSQRKPVIASTLRFTGLHMFTSKQGFAQSSHQVWRTTDGGADWTNASPANLPASSAINVHFASADTAFATFTVALRPGRTRVVVDRTTDGGGQWTTASFVVPNPPAGRGSGSAPVVAGLAFIPPRLGWISLLYPQPSGGGPAAGTLWVTRDAGSHWTPVRKKPFRTMGGVRFLTPRTGWFFDATGGFGVAPGQTYSYVTENGGETWAQRHLPVPSPLRMTGQSVPYVRVWSPSRAVVALLYMPDHLVINRSQNAGQTWTASPALTLRGASPPVLSFVNPADGWLWTDGVLYRTTNGGGQWTVLNRRLKRVQQIQYIDPSVGFLLTAGKVLVTNDGGSAWHRS